MGIAINNDSWDTYIVKRFQRVLITLSFLIACCLIVPSLVGAEDGQALTDLFSTAAFTGSWKVFSKFNWLGSILNFFISAFCLIGLMLTAFRILLTLLYKSNEVLFDKIHSLHGNGNGVLAIKDNLLSAVGVGGGGGNFGTGVDAIINFVLSLMPDIVMYSDYNPDKMMYNLKEDDTMTTYLLKISLPTIMAIFFFSIGFNGTLLKAYGTVAEAMAKGSQRFIEEDLTEALNKVASAGASYSFPVDSTNDFDKYRCSIKKSIYAKMLMKTTDLTTSTLQTLGKNIDTFVNNAVTMDLLDQISCSEAGISKTQMDKLYTANKLSFTPVSKNIKAAKNFSFSTSTNQNGKSDGKEFSSITTQNGSSKVVPTNRLCLSVGQALGRGEQNNDWYVHVVITKKSNADETNYFDVQRTSSPKNTAKSANKPQ